MSRNLPTGLDTAFAGQVVAPAFLVELYWSTGVVNIWNGYYNLVWDGKTWLGIGHLGSIAEIKESSDLTANGVQLQMSGIPSARIAEVLTNDSQGLPARIYFGHIAAGGFTVDPYLVFDGVIDYPNITISGETATIQVALERETYDGRTDARRCTHEDQQIDYPGDLGREYVAALPNKQFTWGKATIAPVATDPGTGDGTDPYL